MLRRIALGMLALATCLGGCARESALPEGRGNGDLELSPYIGKPLSEAAGELGFSEAARYSGGGAIFSGEGAEIFDDAVAGPYGSVEGVTITGAGFRLWGVGAGTDFGEAEAALIDAGWSYPPYGGGKARGSSAVFTNEENKVLALSLKGGAVTKIEYFSLMD
jgi:hypothetical protein